MTVISSKEFVSNHFDLAVDEELFIDSSNAFMISLYMFLSPVR